MGATTFSGPIKAGTVKDGANANVGAVVLSQTAVIDADSTNAVDAAFKLPAGAQIVDVLADVLVAFDSATSATLTVGTASAGTQYAGGVNAKTAGRARPAFTAAQLGAMDDIGTTTDVVATVTPSGATTAGQVRVTLVYAQK